MALAAKRDGTAGLAAVKRSPSVLYPPTLISVISVFTEIPLEIKRTLSIIADAQKLPGLVPEFDEPG